MIECCAEAHSEHPKSEFRSTEKLLVSHSLYRRYISGSDRKELVKQTTENGDLRKSALLFHSYRLSSRPTATEPASASQIQSLHHLALRKYPSNEEQELKQLSGN